MWRLLPRLAFMVTARVALKGLWVNFTHLVVTMKPLLSAAALTWISMLLKTLWTNTVNIAYLQRAVLSFSWRKDPNQYIEFSSEHLY